MHWYNTLKQWIFYRFYGVVLEEVLSVDGNKNPCSLKQSELFKIFSDERLHDIGSLQEIKPFDVRLGRLTSRGQSSESFLINMNALKATLFTQQEITEIFTKNKKLCEKSQAIYLLFRNDSGGSEGEIICVGRVHGGDFDFWKADRHRLFGGYVLF